MIAKINNFFKHLLKVTYFSTVLYPRSSESWKLKLRWTNCSPGSFKSAGKINSNWKARYPQYTVFVFDIYFWLRFGLANVINDY